MGIACNDRVAKDYPANAKDEERNLQKPFVNRFQCPANDHQRNETDEQSNRVQVPSWSERSLPPGRDSDEEKSDEGGNETNENER